MNARAKRTPRLDTRLRDIGCKSLAFEAAYRGGTCGLCAETIGRGARVLYFRIHGLTHEPCVTRLTMLEDMKAKAEQQLAAAINPDGEEMKFQRRLFDTATQELSTIFPNRKTR